MRITQSVHHSVRAFTLIETLVSIMIITTVILGPLTVATNASSYARATKDTMTGIYLAQEALELLHHQQDSLYLRCISQVSTACTPEGNETPSEAAWRIFRIRLGFNSQGASCYGDNPEGCAYDFIDMISNEDFPPVKYKATDSSCSTLSISPENLYVCGGAHGTGFTPTPFARVIKITSLPTFSAGDADYNDDLRVVATISFKRINGYVRQIKVVDFFHARS